MRVLMLVAISAAAVARPPAQSAEEPRFEVVSVTVSTSTEPGGRNALEPGVYEGINVTLRRMIALAYKVAASPSIRLRPSWLLTAWW